MNNRPTNTVPGMVRRPLFWALLVSFVLHMPVLAIVVTDGWFTPPRPEPAQMLMTLLAAAEPSQASGVDAVPVPPPESLPAIAPIPASPVSAPLPDPVIPPGPAESVAAVDQTQVVHTTATLFPERQPVPEPVPEPAPQPQILHDPTPPPIQMAAHEVAAMHEVIGRLLQHLNEHNLNELADNFSTDTLAAIDPQALGLLANDTLDASVERASDLTGLSHIDVAVTRQIEGEPHQIRIRLQERALSHYAKFINRWDADVTLGNDRVDGRFHANSEVNFESLSNPRSQFNGEVTIARRQALTRRVRESSMFAAGVRTGTGRIALPQTAFPSHWLESGADVLTLSEDTRLDFQGAAGIVWTDMDNGEQGRVLVPEAGLIIAGTDRARFELSGDVAGRVLVYSPQRQMITGNLLYVDATETSDDYLALISDGSIEIASSTVTGPGDLRIDAALFARDRFSVRRFSDRHQGVLHVYGALVAGSVSATEPRYSTHIEYDPRFEHSRPPAFPGTGLFDVRDWEQHWTAVSDPDAPSAVVVDNAPGLIP